MDNCRFSGCDKLTKARGYCSGHLGQLSRGKSLQPLGKGRTQCSFNGCTNKSESYGLCGAHRWQANRGQELKPIRKRAPNGAGSTRKSGYRNISKPGHPNANALGIIAEHRWVMSQYLGRALYDDENVHHINGNRSDNRIANLELWSTSQPPGQRVQDKLLWARQMIQRYGEDNDYAAGTI